MAEGVGFEPTEPLRALQFSRLAQSTTLPPLRWDNSVWKLKGYASGKPRDQAQTGSQVPRNALHGGLRLAQTDGLDRGWIQQLLRIQVTAWLKYLIDPSK
jgi:hypothetical protein